MVLGPEAEASLDDGRRRIHLGGGYAGDATWTHEQWRGPNFSDRVDFDLTDPAVAGRVPFGAIDHVARVTCDGAVGWGTLEHGTTAATTPTTSSTSARVAP